jgi:hypothetical protein
MLRQASWEGGREEVDMVGVGGREGGGRVAGLSSYLPRHKSAGHCIYYIIT